MIPQPTGYADLPATASSDDEGLSSPPQCLALTYGRDTHYNTVLEDGAIVLYESSGDEFQAIIV